MDDPPRCFFCDAIVSEEFYCYGCQEYVCGLCTGALTLPASHLLEDHQKENPDAPEV